MPVYGNSPPSQFEAAKGVLDYDQSYFGAQIDADAIAQASVSLQAAIKALQKGNVHSKSPAEVMRKALGIMTKYQASLAN